MGSIYTTRGLLQHDQKAAPRDDDFTYTEDAESFDEINSKCKESAFVYDANGVTGTLQG
jgi:hypothetical protein